ncbi:MAG: phosphate/phosphite/phosphonate ABC transporter substrate-binding protein, partial [Anaerolineae bacterium]|nr:phosphate/phosphite/phosphonate ABC transporter substrate-binding protein [Anaerolineae bacterium]
MVVLVQLRLFIPAMFLVLLSPSAYASEQPVYVFGVISQRSPLLTAQYWNPIIRHVSEKSGVPLRVRIGKSG